MAAVTAVAVAANVTQILEGAKMLYDLIRNDGGQNRPSGGGGGDGNRLLSVALAEAEKILDKLEYEQLLEDPSLIRHLKYAIYEAEDKLDEISIRGSNGQVFDSSSLPNSISSAQRSLDVISSKMNETFHLGSSSNSKSHGNGDPLRDLWPRYKELQKHLKKCFRFLSIFPKSHQFDRDNLVQLWKAEDFIRNDNMEEKRLEDIGGNYLDELVKNKIFTNSGDGYRLEEDLLHELAKLASRGECLTINDADVIVDLLSSISGSVRHLSVHCKNYSPKTVEVLARCERLRTMFLLQSKGQRSIHKVSKEQLTSFKFLRVLSISCPSVIEVPDSIGCLRHLRYLDLSNSGIAKLPKTICKLHSLQTLKLNGCKKLRSLPSLEGLLSLQHLLLDKSHHLDSIPPGIEKLTILETFSCPIVLGKGDGEKIGVLKEMCNLRGSLCISKLENVLNLQEANEATLNNKQFLRKLKLKWLEQPSAKCKFQEVLGGLQPHENLKILKISGYGGPTFPEWVTNSSFFIRLKKVSLINCKTCKVLPALWRLPKLESLSISAMDDEIHQLNNEFFLGSGSGSGFSSLQQFNVKNMPNLTSWVIEQDWILFPKLNQLAFKNCPKLRDIEVLQRLNSLCSLRINQECPLIIGWMDQQLGWQKQEQDDSSLIYSRISVAGESSGPSNARGKPKVRSHMPGLTSSIRWSAGLSSH